MGKVGKIFLAFLQCFFVAGAAQSQIKNRFEKSLTVPEKIESKVSKNAGVLPKHITYLFSTSQYVIILSQNKI